MSRETLKDHFDSVSFSESLTHIGASKAVSQKGNSRTQQAIVLPCKSLKDCGKARRPNHHKSVEILNVLLRIHLISHHRRRDSHRHSVDKISVQSMPLLQFWFVTIVSVTLKTVLVLKGVLVRRLHLGLKSCVLR